jgi:DnaK suppressor protein
MTTRNDEAAIRHTLEAERERLRASIAELDAEVSQLGRGDESEQSQLSNHQADAGTDVFEQEQALSLADNERTILERVERALERLAAGQYGRCEDCGQPIPAERLEALPYATLCVPCQEAREHAAERR